ncbi:TIGR03086 family metal-binding protein [Herbiconiux sp. YIM B11900]|uniref:TIGR03086 family metal-binding protein n=1 Tax=Herbiconiux sp. YIM B11900 TaxID=3404131 RepID=UPI003F859380
MLPASPAERHRVVAEGFTALTGAIDGTWDAPAPVEGWVARDVVRHLTGWFPGFLAGGSGVVLLAGPSVDDDPVAAWRVHADAVQAVLDDPATGERMFRNPHTGELPLADAIDRFYTADVFMHTWDLAAATGQDARLDPDFALQLLEGMESMEELIRSSGQYGLRVEVPAASGPVARLLGFIGRDPSWRPPAP